MRSYFLFFFSSYFVILITKFIFVFYLKTQFDDFSSSELIYAIFWGYKFDFAASAIFAFIVTLFDFNKKVFATISSLSIITIFLTQISDILYFEESSRHVGYEIMDIIVDAKSLFMTAFSQHTSLVIIASIISLFLFMIFYTLFKNMQITKFNRYYILKKLFIIILSIFFIRGMFQHIPLHPWQSNEIGNSQLASISLNSIYNIMYSVVNQKKKLEPLSIPKVDKRTQNEAFSTIYKNSDKSITTPIIETKPNVVFFFLESWTAKDMNSYGYEKVTTPIFDKLLKQSIRPKAMIAGGHRTTEGIFATLSSYQNPLGKTIAKTQLQNYKYDSIIYLLNKEGYQTTFFQGTSKDTSGTGSLLSYLGFSESYGKRDIKERIHEENYWGVQDTDLYNFITNKLEKKEIKEPFVIGVNNASTHDKKLPKGEETIKFSDDINYNNKLNTLHYSDKELGKFIKKVETKYPNTIFVIFADHCGGSQQDNLYNYLIPFAIYSKQHIKPSSHDILLSQRDIAPTIYDLIIGKNKEDKKNFSGKSLFNEKNKFYSDYFHNGILGWVEENNVIEINTINKKTSCYKLNNLIKEKINCNLIDSENMINRALSFTNVSQELLFDGETKEFNEYKKNYEK